MNKNLTDITLVVDRSGSMISTKSDAEGGINSLIREQGLVPGEAVLTLVQFNTKYEFVHTGVPINRVPYYTLHPGGNTALLDAVGRAIFETGERLSMMREENRPGLVLFCIVTDGQENASHEYTKDQIKNMIEHQQSKYGWQFTFLGSNQDAFSEAAKLGIPRNSAANYANGSAALAYASASANVTRMREQKTSGGIVVNAFTDQERQDMK